MVSTRSSTRVTEDSGLLMLVIPMHESSTRARTAAVTIYSKRPGSLFLSLSLIRMVIPVAASTSHVSLLWEESGLVELCLSTKTAYVRVSTRPLERAQDGSRNSPPMPIFGMPMFIPPIPPIMPGIILPPIGMPIPPIPPIIFPPLPPRFIIPPPLFMPKPPLLLKLLLKLPPMPPMLPPPKPPPTLLLKPPPMFGFEKFLF